MDTLLKTHNKLQFLHPVNGFSDKISAFSLSKPHNLETKFHSKKPQIKLSKGFCVKASSSALLELVPQTKKENLEFELPMYDPSKGLVVDLAVAMDLLDCLDTTWSGAMVYINENSTKDLDRPYGRVNRKQLKSKMMQKCISNGVKFHQAKVVKVIHEESKSLLICNDGVTIQAAVVLDATGFSRCLVQYDKPYNPEETSLVARPGVSMKDIQERMVARLSHLGIKVKSIEEDEHCVIPMGGPLPVLPQRVVGIGGTAGMVHPSTGYMVARTLAAAPIVANAIVRYLGSDRDILGNDLSAEVWKDLWPIERRRQREFFFCFGMDILLKLDLHSTRRFFDAFFDLEPRYWHGFLSSRLFLPSSYFSALTFSHASTTSRLEIMAKGTVPLLYDLALSVHGVKCLDVCC
ncbi:hypothetical protein DH2020_041400 [Rehmannia glutinosa]|uniref:Lycopene beta-cyclase n=1 Tax=Rehmannia glutinosa TaxID=99300 RepID=A0ABR0UQY7_REHGL